jgi:hypothetical protein
MKLTNRVLCTNAIPYDESAYVYFIYLLKEASTYTLYSSLAGIIDTLSRAMPMLLRPLSTYRIVPVMALASGDSRKAAEAPTSSAYKS